MRLKGVFIRSTSTLLLVTVLCFPAKANSTEHVFGLGFGLPYGGFGVNYEIGVEDYVAPVGGAGYLPDNVGWNVGARVYFPGRESKFRGRITILFGTNVLLERKGYSKSDYSTEIGASGGIGLKWRFGTSSAFDADLFLVDPNLPAGYRETGSDVKVAFGFSYRF